MLTDVMFVGQFKKFSAEKQSNNDVIHTELTAFAPFQNIEERIFVVDIKMNTKEYDGDLK